MTAEACASKLAARKRSGKIEDCFVFGRDSTGLTNLELKKCDYCVTIRTGSEYNTLNVSHAAAVLFYEFSKQFSKANLETKIKFPKNVSRQNQPATRRERERAIMLFQQLGKDAEFKYFEAGLLQESLKRLFGRSDPTVRELYILMGLASKASNKICRLSKA
jgi:tRNA (cytidine32/uridine32-2'-O)-methyltransferase